MGDPDQMQCTARRESDREGRLQAGRAKGRLKTERPRSPWATVRVGEAECTDQLPSTAQWQTKPAEGSPATPTL